MAQIIKHRRGQLTGVKSLTARNAEFIIASGSISDLQGPFVFIGSPNSTDEGVAGAFKSVSKIYQGSAAPSITAGSYGSILDGTPFYASGNESLYILNNDGAGGNVRLDLTGNIEGNVISGVTINNITGSRATFNTFVSASALNVSGNTQMVGNSTVGGTLDVTGNSTVGGTLTVTGNTSLGGTLNVSGKETAGSLEVLGNTSLDGTLAVTGAATLKSSLNVSGATTVDGTTSLNNTLTVSGTTNLNNNTNINGNLNITGNTIQTGSIELTGDIKLGGNINIGDSTTDFVTFGAEVSSSIVPDINNAFDLGSSSKAWRNLYVSGTAYMQNLNLETISLNSLTLPGNLAVSGTTTLGGNTTLNSNLSVAQNTNIGNNLSVTGSATVGYLQVTGNTALNGDATVNGNAIVDGTLTVHSSVSIDDNVAITGAMNVSGAVTASYFVGDGSQLTNIVSTLFITGSDGTSTSTGSLGLKTEALTFSGQSANGLYTQFNDSTNTLTYTLDQSIKTGATPTFNQMTLSSAGTSSTSAVRADRSLTINGTTNQVSVSGGTQNLQGDRTWTVSLPSSVDLGANSSITATSGSISDISSTKVSTTGLTATNGTVTNLTSTSGTIVSLSSTSGSITRLVSTTGSFTDVNATFGTIDTLSSTEATIDNITSTSGSITDLISTKANIATLSGTTGSFVNMNATSASVGTLTTTSGSFTNLSANTGSFGRVTTTDLFVSGTLQVLGGAQTVYMSASTVELDDNIIRLNAYSPFERYAGFEVMDSGSSNVSASVLWDSVNDYWMFVSSSGQSSKFVGTTAGAYGSEVSLTSGTFPIATAPNTIGDSLLTYSGTTLALNTNKFTVNSSNGDTLVSGNFTLSAAGGSDTLTKTSAILFRNSDNVIGYVSTTETEDVLDGILGYKHSNGGLTFSTVIDGGTY